MEVREDSNGLPQGAPSKQVCSRCQLCCHGFGQTANNNVGDAQDQDNSKHITLDGHRSKRPSLPSRQRLYNALMLTWRHVFIVLSRNCIFQAIYAILVISGHIILLTDAMPYLYKLDPDENHMLEPLILFVINALLFVLCSKSDAGDITSYTLSRYINMYIPDGVMYHKDNKCSTCLHRKPARSKHCGKLTNF